MKFAAFFPSPNSWRISAHLQDQESSETLIPDPTEKDEEQVQNYDEDSDSDNHERNERSFEGSGAGLANLLPSKRAVALRSLQGHWCILVNACLFVFGMFAIWKLAVPPPTDLHEHILTDDGKSFPSGQLSWSQKFTALPCGKSPAEAKARGCHFDIIATAWLPPKCIDYELVLEFVAYSPWQYFRDPNGTDPYPDDPDTLGSQEGLVFTTNRWHSAHCMFMWKKLNRALVQGRMTDGETIKQEHTDHCSKTTLELENLDAIEGIMEVIYPPC
jgi:hypothetical protein